MTLLKMLMSTRKMVTRSVILPGTISGGMRKLTQDTGKSMTIMIEILQTDLPRTKRPDGR